MAILRTFVNKPGVEYDAGKTKVVFAEDMNLIGSTLDNHEERIIYIEENGSPGGGATWYVDAGVPDSGLGIDGDFYLNSTNGDVYQKVSDDWGSPVANIKGPQGDQGIQGETGDTGAQGDQGIQGEQGIQGVQGDQGIQGEQGVAGVNGATWYTGSGAPSDGNGANGDLYFRTDTNDVYVKAGGTWGSPIANIEGAQGIQGDQGIQGETGDTGAQGDQGIQGEQGIQGVQGEQGDPGVIEPISINEQTDSYGLVLSDATKLVDMNKATANTLTIPLNSSQAFDVGTRIAVRQKGAGTTSIAAAGGVTINSQDNALDLVGQYAICMLIKVATDTWALEGNLTA